MSKVDGLRIAQDILKERGKRVDSSIEATTYLVKRARKFSSDHKKYVAHLKGLQNTRRVLADCMVDISWLMIKEEQ